MLHYVASQAEKSNPDLLSLPDDLAILDEASKTSVDQLSIEVCFFLFSSLFDCIFFTFLVILVFLD